MEAFLYSKCRDCVETVSPTQLHTWVFGKRHGLDYERRKVEMEMRAAALCGRLGCDPTRWDRETRGLPRRDDVADGLVIAWFAYSRRRAPRRAAAPAPARAGARSTPRFGGWPAGEKGARWLAALS